MKIRFPHTHGRGPDRTSGSCFCVGSPRPARRLYALPLLFSLVSPVLLLACTRSHESVTKERQVVTRLNIRETRGASNLDVFFFDDNPGMTLDSYQRFENWDGSPVGAASRSGNKYLVLLCNYGTDRYSYGAMNCYDALSGISFRLPQEDPGAPLMSGECALRAGDDSAPVLNPALSRIRLSSLCCDFSSRPYEGARLKNVKVYLTNVCDCYRPLTGETLSWINMGAFSPEDAATLAHPEMLYAEVAPSVGATVLFPDIDLYCYPNMASSESLSERFTRLVIEGTLEGTVYYYPININRDGFGYVSGIQGIEPGVTYAINLAITRTGSTDPDIPVDVSAIRIKTTVAPWDEFPPYNVTY